MAACVGVEPAHAQAPPAPTPTPERPTQQVFRGDRRDTQSRQSLSLNGSMWAGYSSHLVGSDAVGTSTEAPGVKNSGWYPSGEASLSYNRRANRLTFGSDFNT